MIDLKTIWKFADVAYDEPNGSEPLFKGIAKNFYQVKTDLDFGFVAEFDDFSILSFRGTDTQEGFSTDLVKRWIRNISVLPLVIDGGTIHRGFYEAWKKLKPLVREIIDKLPYSNAIYITGHSLGADLAYLAARDLVKNYAIKNDRVFCRPFAPAGLFTTEGVSVYYNLKIDTVFTINGYDIVEEFPPLVRPGIRTWLYQPIWHKFFHRIRDHFTSNYSKAFERKDFAKKFNKYNRSQSHLI